MIKTEFQFDHLGIAVESIGSVIKLLQNIFGIDCTSSNVYIDEQQKSKIAFVQFGGIIVELIEPISEDSPVSKYIEKCTNLYHMCFRTKNIDEIIHDSRESGAIVISKPVKAKAFNGKRVAFVYFNNLGLVEWVEE